MTAEQTLARNFVALAIKKGFVSKEQANKAIQEQKRQLDKDQTVLISDILTQSGVITEEQRDELIGILKKLSEQKAAKNKKAQADEAAGTEQDPPVEEEDEDAEPPNLEGAKKVQTDSGFELAIQEDRYKAFIYPVEEETPEIGLEDAKALLEMERISYGIVDDSKIVKYLESNPKKDEIFMIAKGDPSDLGTQTEIKYLFKKNLFSTVTIDEDGNIDHKNRGKIPQAKAEDLLAEIIPGAEGTPGKDIYGETVEPPPPDLVSLLCGQGVKKSEDGLKAHAELDGLPELQDDGTINVSDTLSIGGDVGIETGHIEFDGHIKIKGGIQEGYIVKGKSIETEEILGAEVEATENIVVKKGIIGAKILSDGAVKAKHIRDTTIDALEDVTVEKEVYESHIETNGIFRIDRGTVMGSSISAMKGVDALEIGSPASDPCTIITGIDNRLEKQVTTLNLQIAEKEKEREALEETLEALKDMPEILEDEIGEKAQQQDRAMVKGQTLKQTLKSLQEANDRKNIIKVVKIIKGFNNKLEEMQGELDALIKKQEKTEEDIKNSKNKITEIDTKIEEFQDDIKSILEIAKIRQPSEGVRARGSIYDRTSIKGRNASLLVKGTLKNVIVQEAQNQNGGSDNEWVMTVTPS